MDKAIVVTAGLLKTSDAKTAHGLIRKSNRFKILAIIDETHAGEDAGVLLDGHYRGIPVLPDISAAISLQPAYCIVGVATTLLQGCRRMVPLLENIIKHHNSPTA